MNGAEAFVRTLRESGIDTFFGLPGSTEAPLLEAIRADGGIRYVLALHESGAVAMADGYARATGRPGVIGLHTTVGTMNGMSQVYNAARDCTPLVVTAGHKDRMVLTEDGFCALPDLASLMRPFTRSSWQSLSAEAIAPDLARAIHFAMTPPRGPTYLAIPEDLMGQELDDRAGEEALPGVGRLGIAAAPDAADVRAAAEMLASARKPVIVIGTHASRSTAAVRAFAEAFEVPVLAAELMDLAMFDFPTDDPHYLGVYGEEQAVLDGCDLVVAAGCRAFFPFSMQARPRLPSGAKLVHIHPDAAEIGRVTATAVGLAGEPATILRQLVGELEAAGGLGRERLRERGVQVTALAAARRRSVESELKAASGSKPIAVAQVAAELGRSLPAGAIIVEEAVRGSRLVFRHCTVPEGSEIWRSSGGSLGWGLPAAVGAKLGRPDRPVILVTGDGSFHFSVQALWTAVAQKLPMVVVILDNGGYLAVKRAVEGHLKVPHDPRTHPGTEISGIDHLEVARGYGAEGRLCTDPEDLADALSEGMGSDKVHVIAVRVAKNRP